MSLGLPTFPTARLLLRPVTLADAPSWEKRFVDYEVVKHLGGSVPWPYPAGGVADFLSKVVLPRQGLDRWVWAITLPEAPAEVIGAVDLWREGRPEHRGFWLGRAFWGRGYMTEAVAPVTDYAFGALGFEKLVFSNGLGNVASRRVKEKAGARFVGTNPAKFVSDTYTEQEVWELTREEWAAIKAARKKSAADESAR